MQKLFAIKKVVKEELIEFDSYFKNSVKTKIKLLDVIMRYILRSKGKQLRPLFVFLISKLYGNISTSTHVAATLIELLHTASLVHDDVIDNSNERRGWLSINVLWKSKIAVLVGDFLLSKGLLIAVKNKEYELLEIVSKAVEEMSEGELKQLQQLRKFKINEEEYFEIIRKKTAVLIASCCACGAKSAGASEQEINKMWHFGELLGIAFQIKDDLFDYTSHSFTGKSKANDIKEKKKTLPLIYSLNKATIKERKHIIKLVQKDKKSAHHIQEIKDFVISKNGIEYANAKMEEKKNEALALLSDINDSEAKTAIIELADYVINRKK